MKTRHHIPVALLGAFIAATSALHATAVENTLSVPMPDFQTPAQLAKWRAETTAKTVAKEAAQTASSRLSTVDSSTFSLNSGVPTPLAPPQGSGAARSSQSNQLPPVAGFYTGKPYLAESGSYAFKYREYNPEMTRWTTVDPSGFPDGANNRVYAASPTTEFDNNGLQLQSAYGTSAIPALVTDADFLNAALLAVKQLTAAAGQSSTILNFWTLNSPTIESAISKYLNTCQFSTYSKNTTGTLDGNAQYNTQTSAFAQEQVLVAGTGSVGSTISLGPTKLGAGIDVGITFSYIYITGPLSISDVTKTTETLNSNLTTSVTCNISGSINIEALSGSFNGSYSLNDKPSLRSVTIKE